jgi:Protein required for attachment to host cells
MVSCTKPRFRDNRDGIGGVQRLSHLLEMAITSLWAAQDQRLCSKRTAPTGRLCPFLGAARVYMDENPLTREQGSDRPSCAFKRAGTNRRAAMGDSDWHEFQQHRFARRVAAALETLVHEPNVKALMVAATPHTLAELRHAFHVG